MWVLFTLTVTGPDRLEESSALSFGPCLKRIEDSVRAEGEVTHSDTNRVVDRIRDRGGDAAHRRLADTTRWQGPVLHEHHVHAGHIKRSGWTIFRKEAIENLSPGEADLLFDRAAGALHHN